jgi:hypothetical protein
MTYHNAVNAVSYLGVANTFCKTGGDAAASLWEGREQLIKGPSRTATS